MSSVLKEGRPPCAAPVPATLPPLSRRVEDAREEGAERAASLLAEAKRAAEEMVARARAEAEGLRREAREQGYASGQRAAEEELSAETVRLRRTMEGVGERLRAEYERLIEGLPAGVARLALTVAERFLRRQIEERPELLAALAGEAVGRFGDASGLRVRVLLPAQAARVGLERLQEAIGALGVAEVELVEGPDIGVVVTGERGTVDGRISQQAERLEQTWTEEGI